MSKLPDELITYILLRVPAKSLSRFRFVSKHWCSLIHNNDFIKNHLKLSTSYNKSNQTIAFQVDTTNIYSLSLNSITQTHQLALPININNNNNNNNNNIKLLGSCNGLLCLLYPINNNCNNNVVVVWNPTTRKHVKLPFIDTIESGLVHDDSLTVVYGFGYDSVSDDYKVVKVVQYFPDGDDVVTEIYVYGLRSDSWRKNKDFPNYLLDNPQRPDTVVCGALHWVMTGYDFELECATDPLVVAFDLAKEEHEIIPMPDFHKDGSFLIVSVFELDRCLSVVHKKEGVGAFDLWVMKDYGVEDSWTKMLSLSGSEIGRTVNDFVPLSYSEIGDEVLFVRNSEELLWCNLENLTFKSVNVHGVSRILCPVILVESIVSVGDRGVNDQKQSREDRGAKENQEQEAQNAFATHLGKRDRSSCSRKKSRSRIN